MALAFCDKSQMQLIMHFGNKFQTQFDGFSHPDIGIKIEIRERNLVSEPGLGAIFNKNLIK